MQTRIVEVSSLFNWGKFLVGWFDVEWKRRSVVSGLSMPLLREIGWGPEHVWVLDLQTGEGAYFLPTKYSVASSDLREHRIWVCPLFEPFLQWLYQQTGSLDWADLPEHVSLPNAPFSVYGYRREGPETKQPEEARESTALRKRPEEAREEPRVRKARVRSGTVREESSARPRARERL